MSEVKNEDGENKPDIPKTHITLKVLSTKDNHEVIFRVKRSIPLKSLMEDYLRVKQMLVADYIYFVHDGKLIKPSFQTPEELGMQDGDVMFAVLSLRGS